MKSMFEMMSGLLYVATISGIDLMVFNTLKERWIQNNTSNGANLNFKNSSSNKWLTNKSEDVAQPTPDVLTLVLRTLCTYQQL